MKYIKYSLILLVFALVSCDLGSEPTIEGTKLQAMCGEWYIGVFANGEDIGGGGRFLITTSNTAANNETDLIINDHELLTPDADPVAVVAKVNLPAMTFDKADKLPNMEAGKAAISIIEGKILKGAATSTGGNKTDSIYVKFTFANDPATEWIYAGYRRTGFLEDEH
ncbi:lipid-binding protein [Dyadobacter jiangsuensis]